MRLNIALLPIIATLTTASPGNEPLCDAKLYCSAGATVAYYRENTSEHVCYVSCLSLEDCSGYYTSTPEGSSYSRCYVLTGQCTAFEPDHNDGTLFRYWDVTCPDPDDAVVSRVG